MNEYKSIYITKKATDLVNIRNQDQLTLGNLLVGECRKRNSQNQFGQVQGLSESPEATKLIFFFFSNN